MIRTGAFVAATLFALFASANAPVGQYGSFSPGTPTISDKKTSLNWQRFITLPPMSQTAAITSCKNQTPNPMRLPTYRELLTLVDEDPHEEWDPDAGKSVERYIDPNAFPGTPAGLFWSMSPNVTNTSTTTKGVDFSSGATGDLHASDTAYVRCVLDN